MIKCETIGMILNAKNDPTLTHDTALPNYSFITKNDELYVIMNTGSSDEAYKHDFEIPAGEPLNGFLVKAWDGQYLIVDGKHIDGFESIALKDKLEAQENGTLKKAESPTGIYLEVVETNIRLTEKAVKVKVVAGGTSGE